MSISLRALHTDGRNFRSLQFVPEEQVTIKNSKNGKAVLLGNPKIVKPAGKDEEENNKKLMHNRFVELKFGTIETKEKDEVLVALNPKLASSCLVSGPVLLSPKELHTVSISIYPLKQIDLADYDWIVALYSLS